MLVRPSAQMVGVYSRSAETVKLTDSSPKAPRWKMSRTNGSPSMAMATETGQQHEEREPQRGDELVAQFVVQLSRGQS